MRISDWLPAAAARLENSSSSRRDAEILLSFVTGKNRSWLRAFDETLLDETQLSALSVLIDRRANGEPVAHLTGVREFWSLSLRVSPLTLIPRPETEVLVECALDKMDLTQGQVLDLGTGTGAIALALASERPDWHITGVDFLNDVVELAQLNAECLALSHVCFILSDWFSAVGDRRFNLIVTNPPYIDADDIHLTQGDVRFESASALIAGEQGLADIRHIVSHAGAHLLSGGWLLIEHGWQQAEKVRQILISAGFVSVGSHRDYGGNERVTFGRAAK